MHEKILKDELKFWLNYVANDVKSLIYTCPKYQSCSPFHKIFGSNIFLKFLFVVPMRYFVIRYYVPMASIYQIIVNKLLKILAGLYNA